MEKFGEKERSLTQEVFENSLNYYKELYKKLVSFGEEKMGKEFWLWYPPRLDEYKKKLREAGIINTRLINDPYTLSEDQKYIAFHVLVGSTIDYSDLYVTEIDFSGDLSVESFLKTTIEELEKL